MAKLTRKNQKIFGTSAPAGEIRQFGSAAEGAPLTTTDPETIQALATRYNVGLPSALVTNSEGYLNPLIEDYNALFYLLTYQLFYLFEAGIAEYNALTTYYIGSYVKEGSDIYVSITNSNLNNLPSTDGGTNWTLYINQALATSSDVELNTLAVGTSFSTGSPALVSQAGATSRYPVLARSASGSNNLAGIYEETAEEGIYYGLASGVIKIELNPNGDSYFIGGAIGFGNNAPGPILDSSSIATVQIGDGSTSIYASMKAGTNQNALWYFENDARAYHIGIGGDDVFSVYDDTVNATRLSIATNGQITISQGLLTTLLTAAQPNITSLGTLTNLDVDNININGDTISNSNDLVLDAFTRLGSGNVAIKTQILDIGDWNMDTTAAKSVALSGIGIDKIRSIDVQIRDDGGASASVYPIGYVSSGTVSGTYYTTGTNVELTRDAAGLFDGNVNFDSTSYNRGWVTVTYVE
jgi:hypothetical protein